MSSGVTRRKLHGVLPAVLTPLDERDGIDFQILEKQIRYLVDAGVDGLFMAGTTAEGIFLTTEQKRDVFTLAREIAGPKLTVCLVALRPSTEDVVHEMEAIASVEPDYVAAVTPLYYGASQQAIANHFRRILDAAPAPFILYNIPQNTHNVISTETILELSEDDRVVGVKDSSGNFVEYTRGVLGNRSPGFAWIQGEDLLDAPSFMLGAPGIVTGLGNVWIQPYVAMYRAAREGNTEALKEEQRRIQALARIIYAAGGEVIPAIKTATTLLGRATPYMHISGSTLGRETAKEIKHILKQMKLL